MFEHISRYFGVRQKYFAGRRTYLQVLFLSFFSFFFLKCGHTRSFVFDVFHELLHLFRGRPIVIHRFAVDHLLLWLHTLHTQACRNNEIRWETANITKYLVMTTTQGETPISISIVYPTFTVLEARPLKDNPSEIFVQPSWSNSYPSALSPVWPDALGK